MGIAILGTDAGVHDEGPLCGDLVPNSTTGDPILIFHHQIECTNKQQQKVLRTWRYERARDGRMKAMHPCVDRLIDVIPTNHSKTL